MAIDSITINKKNGIIKDKRCYNSNLTSEKTVF